MAPREKQGKCFDPESFPPRQCCPGVRQNKSSGEGEWQEGGTGLVHGFGRVYCTGAFVLVAFEGVVGRTDAVPHVSRPQLLGESLCDPVGAHRGVKTACPFKLP